MIGDEGERPQRPEREDLFTNRTPNGEQAEVLDAITAAMLAADAELTRLLPESRYLSHARTNLEQASMWAKKAAVFTT